MDGEIEKRSEGRTRDISEMGVFVLAGTGPPAGAEIGFEFFLPVLPRLERKTRVEAVGQVVRVEQFSGGSGCGFAVMNRQKLLAINNHIHESRKRGGGKLQVSRPI